jgi:hypothetical protein
MLSTLVSLSALDLVLSRAATLNFYCLESWACANLKHEPDLPLWVSMSTFMNRTCSEYMYGLEEDSMQFLKDILINIAHLLLNTPHPVSINRELTVYLY